MDRDEIMEIMTPQISRWVKGFVSKYPDCAKNFDDIHQTAVLKCLARLTTMDGEGPPILDRFDGKFDKLSAYLRLTTWTAFSDFLRSNAIVAEPHSRERTPCERLKSEPEAAEIPKTPLERGEVLKRLFDITQDQTDAKILQAKTDGAKTAREVSDAVGVSMATVYRRLKVMKNRYKSK